MRKKEMFNISSLFQWFKRKSPAEAALYIVVSIIFMAVALSYLYIVLWTFFSSVRTHQEIVLDPFGLPTVWHWEHFIEMFSSLKVNGYGFFGMLFNSIYFTVTNVLIVQFTTYGFAYACTRYKFPGSGLPMIIILFTMTLPLYGSGGSSYMLIHKMGLVNSYLQPILSFSGMSATFLYYRAYLQNMSFDYFDAGSIDGANDLQIYTRIMIPLSKPILGAFILTSWMSEWNNYASNLIYLPKLPTLSVGIYEFNTQMIYYARLDVLFAACLFMFIPSIILFIINNKMLTTSVSIGGLKG